MTVNSDKMKTAPENSRTDDIFKNAQSDQTDQIEH